MKAGLLLDAWQKIEDIISGFFAIIPQVMYLLYTSMASLLDVIQLVLRKLVGLDSYYVTDPANGELVSKSGDILKEFFEGILGINRAYSSLSTVFWSLVVFGVIVLVLCTIFSIIKAHYNYDDKKSNPLTILKDTTKYLALMVITPITVVFGLYLSEVLLKSLDQITSSDPSIEIASVYEGEALPNIKSLQVDANTTYYASYDMYYATEWTSSTTFSGMMFQLMASSANRIRTGSYTATKTVANSNWDNCDIFFANLDSDGDRDERVANQIDFAFVNCLTLTNPRGISIRGSEAKVVIGSSLSYGPSAAFALGLIKVEHFSKFNVGLVWYYYNLWAANYVLGFAGVLTCLTLLSNIVFGLMKRLVLCTALFLVSSPVIGISPLDGGNGFKEWRKNFISYFISGFGAVIGMNIFFLILPVLQNISFFDIDILDKIFNMVIIIAGLTFIKKLIALISSFIGATNLEDEGGKVKSASGNIAGQALKKTLATASLGLKVGGYALTGGVGIGAIKKIAMNKTASKMVKQGVSTGKDQALEKLKQQKAEKKQVRQAKIKNSVTKVKNGFGRVMATPLGKLFLNYSGIASGPIFESKRMMGFEYDEEGNITSVDDSGNPKKVLLSKEETRKRRNAAKIKQFRDNFVDISDGILKAVGATTGLKKAWDNLEKAGVVDEGRMAIQNFFQVVGAEATLKAAQDGGIKGVSTSKQVEKAQKKATEAHRQKMSDAAVASKQAADAVFQLTQSLKRK